MRYKVSKEELTRRQKLSLNEKIDWFIERYLDFVEVFGSGVYIAYSGGKDSDVMRDIIHKVHSGFFEDRISEMAYVYAFTYKHEIMGKKPPESVFCNTGLEFPEIVEHVKRFDDVVVLKPKLGFTRFITEVGVAVGSKQIAMQIRRLKEYLSNPKKSNEATKNLYLTGYKRDGSFSQASKLPEKWKKLLDAPFNVTDKCCDNFKKDPFKEYEKKSKKKPIVGTTAQESAMRAVSYLKTGCISLDQGKERLRPMSIFTSKDVWEYSQLYNLRFCEVYYDREADVVGLDGKINKVFLEAETETGCTFCMFGLHLEPKNKPNRIERLKISHPKYHDIVVNKCGLGTVLDWLEIKY